MLAKSEISHSWSGCQAAPGRFPLRQRLTLLPLLARAVTRVARRRYRAGLLAPSTMSVGRYLVGADNGDLLLGHPCIRY